MPRIPERGTPNTARKNNPANRQARASLMPNQRNSTSARRTPERSGRGFESSRYASSESCRVLNSAAQRETRCLTFFREPGVFGHCCLHKRLERTRVDLRAFRNVDRPSRTTFQAGIENVRWIRDAGATGERELHGLRVLLAGADDSVVRPDRNALHRIRGLLPFPLLDHLGVGFEDQRPHAGKRLLTPIPLVADRLIDRPARHFSL